MGQRDTSKKVCQLCGCVRDETAFTLDLAGKCCDRCMQDWECRDDALHDNYGEIRVGKLNV